MTRIATVNRAIRKLDPTAELVKGKGYFYFDGESIGGMSPRGHDNSVMVCRVTDLTLEQWVGYFRDFQQQEASY
jgi:hypothetical protein